ncbi:ABC-three component system protein [Shewanella frigidimarina]|uniref:ABC-three component system protein n=1 Tax=Shewanella frigidimarina TaxID=56812 RepID=UPI003D79B952
MAILGSNNNKVSQDGISAGGHVAGRDIINNYNNLPASNESKPDNKLRSLIEEHENEKLRDSDYKQFSERLNDFLNRKVESKLRNLEQKLSDGDRTHIIEYAMEVKESVTKKILLNSHYESAQKIYTYLLTNIRAAFLHQVSSRIKSKDFQSYQIDDFVLERIIVPTLKSIDGCSLSIDADEIYGLLYILTGNCYIEWD